MKKTFVINIKTILGIIFTILLVACGDGDSNTNNDSDPIIDPASKPKLTGVIIDSPIVGLHYVTSSGIKGDTNALGEFGYRKGDTITFSLANVTLPAVQAKNVITPFDLFNTLSVTDNQLINFLRLIQSMDDDGIVDEAIVLSAEHIQFLEQANVTESDLQRVPEEFEILISVQNLVANISHINALVSRDAALQHFLKSLANSSIVDFDADGIANLLDHDDDNDGWDDAIDDLWWDASEQSDLDGDGIGDNRDLDDDNDQIPDTSDTNNQVVMDLASNLPPITDYVFDHTNRRLYITHKNAFSLSVVNLDTGGLIETLTFNYMPERMTMSADGSTLYVALLVQEHSSYWWDTDQSGYIAVIDTATLTQSPPLAINTDPYDLVVTSTGKLIVASGSGQWTNIFAYDASNGALLGQAGIRQASRLSLHPSENWVFAANTDTSPSDIEKFDIRGVGITSAGDSPYHGDHRMSGNVWATPDGLYVITRGGDMFRATDMTYVRGLTMPSVFIKEVSFDQTAQIALLVLSSNAIEVVNLQSLESIDTLTLFGTIHAASSTGQKAYYLAESAGLFSLIKKHNPCPKCATNTVPTASFNYTPVSGDTTDTYVFNASTSSDAEDGGVLRFRWDLNNDGVWDTPFNTANIYSHNFILAGTKFVRLQVKDSGGLTSTTMRSFDVAQGVDSGTDVTNSTAFELQFTTTDIEVDSLRSKAYITDKNAYRLYVVDLNTGLTERYFEFDYMPERMTMAPDGSALYLALLVQEHSYYWWDEDQTGFIAVFDLEQQAQVNMLAINTDPYDLVVTSNGKLIVSSGSGQWTNIFAYDASNGALLGQAGIRQASRLSLHPSENWVFAANTDSSPSDIEKFDISGVGIVSLGDSPYHGTYRMSGNVWATPDGLYVITRGGDVFRASDMTFVRNLTATGLSINQLAFDTTENVVFVVGSDGVVRFYNLSSFELINTVDGISNANWVIVNNNAISIIAPSSISAQLIPVAHPCLGCGANTAPQAAFTYTPIIGDTTDTYVFDASTSSDAEDGNALQFRWDLDNNGIWDTPFSVVSTYSHNFILAGTQYVRLEVKDSGGLINTTLQSFDVAQGVSTGTNVTDSTAYALQFTATDVEVDALRSKAYITDKAAQRLYVVDLTTGFTERYFDFGFMPERMTMAPDGSTLYVALLVQEHSSYWWDEDQTGYIAVFDLEQQAQVNMLAINTDPYDLVVTSNGKLIVSSGSGQWTNIFAYNASNGALLGQTGIYQGSRLSLHPSENWVFAADTGLSPSDIEKFDISGVGIVALGDSPYHGTYRMGGNVWATPDGVYVITRGGDVFLSSDMTFVRSLTAPGVSIKQLAFDAIENVVFVVGSNSNIYYYNLTTFELINTVDGVSNPEWVLVENSNLFFVAPLVSSSSELIPVAHPCLGCGANAAPQAAFTYTPLNGDTTDTYVFDASTSSDAEDGNALQFRWDLDNNGIWDTPFSVVSSYSHNFTLAGTKYVRLQVKDSGGLTDTISQSLNVSQGVNTGTGVNDSTAFALQFTTTDVEVDALRSKAYITDKAAQRLYVVDLTTGFTERYFDFGFMPERMTMAPDGSTLYVALLVQEHSSYWWDEDQTGYIAVFDLEQQAQVNTLAINTDPYDLVVTGNGKLIVSSGSGQWTNIFAYNASDGALLGQVLIRQASRLSLHPSENWVFAADTDISPSDIEKFDISGVGIVALGDSPYHGTYRMGGNVWVTPDGQYVITRGGDIFTATDMTFVASLTNAGIAIFDLAFDEANQTLVAAGTDGSTYLYDLTTWSQLGINNNVVAPQFVLHSTESFFAISKEGSSSTLHPVTF